MVSLYHIYLWWPGDGLWNCELATSTGSCCIVSQCYVQWDGMEIEHIYFVFKAPLSQFRGFPWPWRYPDSWMVFMGKSYLEMDDLGVPLWLRKPLKTQLPIVEKITQLPATASEVSEKDTIIAQLKEELSKKQLGAILNPQSHSYMIDMIAIHFFWSSDYTSDRLLGLEQITGVLGKTLFMSGRWSNMMKVTASGFHQQSWGFSERTRCQDVKHHEDFTNKHRTRVQLEVDSGEDVASMAQDCRL